MAITISRFSRFYKEVTNETLLDDNYACALYYVEYACEDEIGELQSGSLIRQRTMFATCLIHAKLLKLAQLEKGEVNESRNIR
jgi:hypothetical protein